jgi:hypothetical protein
MRGFVFILLVVSCHLPGYAYPAQPGSTRLLFDFWDSNLTFAPETISKKESSSVLSTQPPAQQPLELVMIMMGFNTRAQSVAPCNAGSAQLGNNSMMIAAFGNDGHASSNLNG